MEQSKIYRTKEKFDSIVNQTENEFIDYWYAVTLCPYSVTNVGRIFIKLSKER